MDNPSPLTQWHTKLPGAAAKPAEPGPNQAGMGGRAQRVHNPPDPWGRDTAKQDPNANSNAEDHTECGPVHAPAQGGQREEQAKSGGRGGGAENGPQPPNHPPTPRRGQTPYPEGTEDRTPKGAQGDHQAKTGNTKPGTAAHREKGHQYAQTHTTLKKNNKRASNRARKRGEGGTGTTRPGTETASDRHHKAEKKTHPDNPTKKGGAQPRPGPSTHAHTAHPSQERRGTSGARAQTRTPAQHPQPGGAGDHLGRAHEHTHTPIPLQGVAGRS